MKRYAENSFEMSSAEKKKFGAQIEVKLQQKTV